MKQAITLRIDPDLLARAKGAAARENRTLTNYIETLLKQQVITAEFAPQHADQAGQPHG